MAKGTDVDVWAKLLRRTFAAPEQVGDEAAFEYVVGLLAPEEEYIGPWDTTMEKRDAILGIIASLVRRGSDGQLDRVITGHESARPTAEAVSWEIYDQNPQRHWSEARRIERIREVANIAETMLAHITVYVKDHSLEAVS